MDATRILNKRNQQTSGHIGIDGIGHMVPMRKVFGHMDRQTGNTFE